MLIHTPTERSTLTCWQGGVSPPWALNQDATRGTILSCRSVPSSCGQMYVCMSLTRATGAKISKCSWNCAARKPPQVWPKHSRDKTGSHHSGFKTLSDKEVVWNSTQTQQKNSSITSCSFCCRDLLNWQIYTFTHKHKIKFKALQTPLGFSVGLTAVADRRPHGGKPNQHQPQQAKRRISSALLTCGKPALQSSSLNSSPRNWASRTRSDDKSVLQAL